ncbi:MAG: LysM peptidoglycan-binding domain-containing protein [Gammaproteobacteria bacterium]
MFILKNKLVSALIAINVIFFMIIYSLLVKNKEPAQDDVTRISSQPQPVTEETFIEPAHTLSPTDANASTTSNAEATVEAPATASQSKETIGESIRRVINATTNAPIETKTADTDSNKVDVFYDGNMVRMEETDSEGNRHTTISNSLDDIGKLSQNDNDYVNALNELKQGDLSHVSFSTTSETTAKHQIEKLSTHTDSVDHFNKVDVSQQTTGGKKKPSLAQQISQVVTANDDSADALETQTDSYLETLNKASKERKNEMRTIKVKRGDTLWVMARRAYGSGFQYPKIYKANPHLTSPNKIKVGDILRVPL